jgi:PEGA domain-containing protein
VLRNQPAGSRAIRVALDGYEPWSAAVRVVADTETHLRAELRSQRPSAQP